MAGKKWAIEDHRSRMIGAAKAMADGLIADYPNLAIYEASIVRTLYDFGEIVGNHVADFGAGNGPVLAQGEAEDGFDSNPEPRKGTDPKPLEYSVFGPIDLAAVA